MWWKGPTASVVVVFFPVVHADQMVGPPVYNEALLFAVDHFFVLSLFYCIIPNLYYRSYRLW